jgi:hypothetical protein
MRVAATASSISDSSSAGGISAICVPGLGQGLVEDAPFDGVLAGDGDRPAGDGVIGHGGCTFKINLETSPDASTFIREVRAPD